jgi:PAS domain S-box-containing protein
MTANTALPESDARFQASFDFAAVGVGHAAPDGRFLRVNRKLCEIVGYTREELHQRTFQDITHPADLGADLGRVQRVLAGELESYTMEKRYIHKSGAIVWVNLSVSLVRQPDGGRLLLSIVETSPRASGRRRIGSACCGGRRPTRGEAARRLLTRLRAGERRLRRLDNDWRYTYVNQRR